MTTQPQELRAPTDTFALRLVIARHHRGLSQAKAAEMCGLNESTWATWERGARPHNQTLVVERIARGLNLPREWLAWGGPLRPEHDPDEGLRTAPSSSPWGGVSPTPIRTMQPKNLAESA